MVHHTPLSVTSSHLAAQLTPHTATPPPSLFLSAPVTPHPTQPSLGTLTTPSSPKFFLRTHAKPSARAEKCKLSSFWLQESAGCAPTLALTAPSTPLQDQGSLSCISKQLACTSTLRPPPLSRAWLIKKRNTGGAGGNQGGDQGQGKCEGMWPDGAGQRGHVARRKSPLRHAMEAEQQMWVPCGLGEPPVSSVLRWMGKAPWQTAQEAAEPS